MKRGVWLAVAASLAVPLACSKQGPEPAASAPPIVTPSSLPTAEPSASRLVDAGPIVAWTDPAAIDALTRSCAFDPSNAGRGPLGCALDFEQSCVPDPCEDERREKCAGQCGRTCSSCGESCTSQCETCKTPCKDEACRRACATRCGECRQGCLTARDQCRSGTCAAEYTACRKRLVASWVSHKCDGLCAPFITCRNKCAQRDKEGEDCSVVCFEKVPGSRECKPNEMICDAMLYAPERRQVDPAWKANGCDDACAKIWRCARDTCNKGGCVEPIKEFEGCRARIAPPKACGHLSMLCPEPEE